jgi:hypothetical protein
MPHERVHTTVEERVSTGGAQMLESVVEEMGFLLCNLQICCSECKLQLCKCLQAGYQKTIQGNIVN